MRNKILASVALVVFSLLLATDVHANGAIALTGQVSSQKERLMEGVVVGAKKDGSTMTVNVVSDAKGRFAFPGEKLEPGHYALKVRAVGYDLDGPQTVDVVAGKTATANLRLKAADNPSAQLTDAEWLLSIPGTEQQKNFLLSCNGCHTIERIVKANKSAEEWVQVFRRMSTYAPGSSPLRPQVTVGSVQRDRTRGVDPMELGAWLANVNASYNSKQSFPLKTLPRPKGKATHTIITEYDLPRKLAMPHDVVLDSEGLVWYSDFGEQFIGRLNPKTGEVTEFPIPVLKKGFPLGTLDLQLDKEQNVWVSLMYQGGIAKFDRKTEKFQVYPVPKEWQGDHTQQSMVSPANSHVDGKVWTNNQDTHAIYRLDIATGQYENLGEFQIPGAGRWINAYGIPSDSENNLYLLDSAPTTSAVSMPRLRVQVFSTIPGLPPAAPPIRCAGSSLVREYGATVGSLIRSRGKSRNGRCRSPGARPTTSYRIKTVKFGRPMWTDRVTRLDPRPARPPTLWPRETNIRQYSSITILRR